MKQPKDGFSQDEIKMIRRKLSIFFTKDQYIVLTNEIGKLIDKIELWIDLGSTGAIVTGNPRIGKSAAIRFVISYLHKEYDPEFPVFYRDADSNIMQRKPKQFYQELLDNIGFNKYKERDSVYVLKKRLVNALVALGRKTDYRKVVFFVDEAQNLTYPDFVAMIELYNLLDKNDINITTILIGDDRLNTLKEKYIEENHTQIIGRFMLHEHRFHGITSELSLMFILDALDHVNYQIDEDRTIQISKDLFPEAYKKGWRLKDLAKDLWNIFLELSDDLVYTVGSGAKEIPMGYMKNVLIYLIREFSVVGNNPVDIPLIIHVKEAVVNSRSKVEE